jgi:hypothetical protein
MLSEDELKRATDLLLVSNTPPFLYRGLKRLGGVKRLATRPIAELQQTILTADTRAGSGPDEATAAGYAALVALLGIADADTLNQLAAAEWHRLQWAPWFVTLEKVGRPPAMTMATVQVLAPTPSSSMTNVAPASSQSASASVPTPAPKVDDGSGLKSVATITTVQR